MLDEKLKRQLPLYLMILAPAVILLVYSYIPMLGIIMAFQDFTPSAEGFLHAVTHSRFVGFEVFRTFFSLPDASTVIYNTVFIASMKIVLKLLVPLIFALLLNEIGLSWYRKLVTTISYLPFFISWVVLGGIFLDFFNPQNGTFNKIIEQMGFEPTFIFGNAAIFPYAVVATDLWQQLGYNTIIFLAALTSIDLAMYEAARIDGAGRWKQMLYVTLPSMAPIVVLVAVLSLGNILNAGQDQIMNLYSPAVYSSGDIIDTYTFRQGIQEMQYSLATAVGLFKSVVSMIMISASYFIANKFTNYRIF